MARKTMADRYAAQRSRKDNRRRSLPRLSDAAPLAPPDREVTRPLGSPDDDGAASETMYTSTATETRPQRSAMPRRSTLAGRRSMATPIPTSTHVDYGYVVRDLKRIAITAVVMLALLIVLNIALRVAIQIH